VINCPTCKKTALRPADEDVSCNGGHVKPIVTSAREQSVRLNDIDTAIGQTGKAAGRPALLVDRFKIGEGMSARQTPREAPAASHPGQSSARSLVGDVAGAFNGGIAARTIASPVGDNWKDL
jgi:methyl-accepting chemotaxis protein